LIQNKEVNNIIVSKSETIVIEAFSDDKSVGSHILKVIFEGKDMFKEMWKPEENKEEEKVIKNSTIIEEPEEKYHVDDL
jgi:hypothetical protein